jgi:hypothetical protein
MKFLIGIISGITLAGAGFAVTSGALSTATASAGSLTAQTALAPETALAVQSPTHKMTTAKRLQTFTGELSRSDTGAIELKISSLQNGQLVDRDVRILVAQATVTNRAGMRVQLPLEAASARVTGFLLPRSTWRADEEGLRIATFSARRVVVLATTPPDQQDQVAEQDTQSAQDAADAQDSSAD